MSRFFVFEMKAVDDLWNEGWRFEGASVAIKAVQKLFATAKIVVAHDEGVRWTPSAGQGPG